MGRGTERGRPTALRTLNQGSLIFEPPADTSCGFDWGFRFQGMMGNRLALYPFSRRAMAPPRRASSSSG